MNVFKRVKYIDNISDTGHITSMWIGGNWYCSCFGYATHKKCKHIKGLVKEMSAFEVEEILKAEAGTYYDSCLDSVNTVFDGSAYNTNEISGIYGKPKVGKSLMCIQESCKLAAEGKNVLFVDTEGSIIPMLKQWVPVFEEKYGKRKGKIYVESKKSIQNLMTYLGHDVKVAYKSRDKSSSSGKLEFSVIKSNDEETPMDKEIKSKKINFIILDSLTSPLREFTKEQQNYPARADATAFIMRSFVRAQENHNVGCLMTCHASFNPANPYETMAEATGGIVMHHYVKRLLYLDKRQATAYRDYRRFWLVRGENAAEFSRCAVTKIDSKGYHDVVDKSELEGIFTISEKNKLDND